MTKSFIICINDKDFFQSFLADGTIKMTDNALHATKFFDLEIARKICERVERQAGKCLIRDSMFTNSQELLEYVNDCLFTALEPLGIDVSVDYHNERVNVCMPDGLRTYRLTLTRHITD